MAVRALKRISTARRRMGPRRARWHRVCVGVAGGPTSAGNIGNDEEPTYVLVARAVDRARWLSGEAEPGDVLLAGPLVGSRTGGPPIEQLEPRLFAGDVEPTPVYRVKQ